MAQDQEKAKGLEQQQDAPSEGAVETGGTPLLGSSSLGRAVLQRKMAGRLIQRKKDEALKAEAAPAPTTGEGEGEKKEEAPKEPDYQKEFDSLAVKGAVEGGLAGYKGIRDSLISTFGSIDKANTYYKGVGGSSFLGKSPMMHKATLGAKLTAAEKLLKDKGWHEAVMATTPSVGGFNVRKNRNADKLSDHSFGWAIDIDAKMNPNVKSFPAGAVKAITGEGMFAGEANSKMSAGGTADELLPWAQKMNDASADFKAAFADGASLKKAMVDYLSGSLGMTIKDADLDIELVKTAKEKGTKTEMAQWKALVAVLAGAKPDIVKAQAQQAEEHKEDYIEENGWSAWAKEKKKIEDADKKKAEKREAETSGFKHPDRKHEVEAAHAAEDTNEIALKAARMLVEMYRIYKASFESEKKGTRKAAQTEGNEGTIAANGFIDLQPTLIAALTGSDGGNLDWLGNAGGTKDFMHFQLKAGDRPALK